VDRVAGAVGDVPHAGQLVGAHPERAVGVRLRDEAAGQQRAREVGRVRGSHQHRGLALELGDRPLGHAAAVGDDDDVVDGLFDLLEHVARDEDRLALTGQPAQEAAQPADPFRVQSVGGLVEDDHPGVPEQCGREAEPLAHAHGVASGALVRRGRDADQLEHLVDPTVLDPADRGQYPQVVASGPARVEVRRLQCRTHLLQRVGDVVVVLAVDRRGALGRPDQPEQHSQGRRFSGAVRAEEAGDPTGLDGEVEVVDGSEAAEAFGQAAHLDARARGGHWCTHVVSPMWFMAPSKQRGPTRPSTSGRKSAVVRGRSGTTLTTACARTGRGPYSHGSWCGRAPVRP